MLDFVPYTQGPSQVLPGAALGPDAWLWWDGATGLTVSIARGRRPADGADTLTIRGEGRQPDDWFSIDVRLGPMARAVRLVMRNYPAHRLYPRLHFDVANGTPFHVNLPELVATDHFTQHSVQLRDWCPDPAFWRSGDRMDRLTLLLPYSPWFVLEVAELTVSEAADA
ncbi:MAG: hypothetical protein AAF674_09815 [Pseudomonadota bacterium]